MHWVASTGECRAAVVIYVHRGKGALVTAGKDADGIEVRRQTWTQPDNGLCTLHVFIHPTFDLLDRDMAQPAAGVRYADPAQYEEDAIPGTWHWSHH